MNRREKLLGTIVAGLLLLGIGIYGIKVLLLSPLSSIKKQTQLLNEKLRQVNDERRAFFSAEDYLKGVVQRSFGRDADVATAQAGKMLTDQILRLGLKETQFSRIPVGPRRMRGAQEVGWSVQGEGPLAKLVDLLFVLEQTPQIHRVDSLVISSSDRPGRIKARFRYLTLVVDAAPGVKPVDAPPKLTLQSPERGYYDAIVQRDLLRPYVPGRDATPANISQTATTGTPPGMLKVVSLSEWQGIPQADVCDLTSNKITSYKLGDTFGPGQIVCVDYRTRPLPGKPGLVSYSRLVLRVGASYWAIEFGQTLADKYELTPDQYPPNLPKPE